MITVLRLIGLILLKGPFFRSIIFWRSSAQVTGEKNKAGGAKYLDKETSCFWLNLTAAGRFFMAGNYSRRWTWLTPTPHTSLLTLWRAKCRQQRVCHRPTQGGSVAFYGIVPNRTHHESLAIARIDTSHRRDLRSFRFADQSLIVARVRKFQLRVSLVPLILASNQKYWRKGRRNLKELSLFSRVNDALPDSILQCHR